MCMSSVAFGGQPLDTQLGTGCANQAHSRTPCPASPAPAPSLLCRDTKMASTEPMGQWVSSDSQPEPHWNPQDAVGKANVVPSELGLESQLSHSVVE